MCAAMPDNALDHAQACQGEKEKPVSPLLEWGQIWPSRAQFHECASTSRLVPVAMKLLLDDCAPVSIYRRLSAGPGTFILESAEHNGQWGRWSFVGVSSQAHLVAKKGKGEWVGDIPCGLERSGRPLDLIRHALQVLKNSRRTEQNTQEIPAHFPPFSGGIVGAWGWDTLYEWEPKLRKEAPDEQNLPDIAVSIARDVVAVDHYRGEVWLIANAINMNGKESGVDQAYDRACERLSVMRSALEAPLGLHPVSLNDKEKPQVKMRVSRDEFEASVKRAHQAIYDGDVFQVVLSQRADIPTSADPLDIYRVLRTINPSPYMYYMHLGSEDSPVDVVGSSPETLVKIENGVLETYPIAGSRPRGAHREEDRQLQEELLADPKERAEHIMLVDLARNDAAKVCKPGTVRVSEFMEIKRFSHIMHISSTVTGQMEEGVSSVDALEAVFPAGTLSGAPKPRAIELIDECEPSRRGLYGGVVGYMDFSGQADLAIAIRTAVIHDGIASVQAGAGIVADSVPETEFWEATNKAAAAVEAVTIAQRLK